MTTYNFFEPQIAQSSLANFSSEKVNLKRERAARYRDQVNNLRNHLDRYISEHPDVGLVKMLLSGSLAKGTALKTITDVDVAVYVKGGQAPSEQKALLEWLVERLRKTYHQIPAEKIYIDGPAIVIEFSQTDINVDVVPVYYDGDPQDRGYIWDRATGEKILTSIPLHIEFIRKRKQEHPHHFRQVIRLAKWWVRQRSVDTPGFALRAFLVELLIAHLADTGTKFDDYHDALESFFKYIQNSGLKTRISFNDNYKSSELPADRRDIVEIFDPVNPNNNVASDMTENQRQQVVNLAVDALDALAFARTATTKEESIQCWKDLMGSTFDA